MMKSCFLCNVKSNVLDFNNVSFQKCSLMLLFRRKKKYKYHDLLFTIDSTNDFGYHSECLKKIVVLKQKDKQEFEDFCKTQTLKREKTCSKKLIMRDIVSESRSRLVVKLEKLENVLSELKRMHPKIDIKVGNIGTNKRTSCEDVPNGSSRETETTQIEESHLRILESSIRSLHPSVYDMKTEELSPDNVSEVCSQRLGANVLCEVKKEVDENDLHSSFDASRHPGYDDQPQVDPLTTVKSEIKEEMPDDGMAPQDIIYDLSHDHDYVPLSRGELNEYTHRHTAPIHTDTLNTTPQRTAPLQIAPNHTTPQHTVPVRIAPQHTVPLHTAPQRTIPQRTVPLHIVPNRTTPQHTVPIRIAPNHTVPLHTTQQHMLPLHTAPQYTVPLNSAPIHTTPLQTNPVQPCNCMELTERVNDLKEELEKSKQHTSTLKVENEKYRTQIEQLQKKNVVLGQTISRLLDKKDKEQPEKSFKIEAIKKYKISEYVSIFSSSSELLAKR